MLLGDVVDVGAPAESVDDDAGVVDVAPDGGLVSDKNNNDSVLWYNT